MANRRFGLPFASAPLVWVALFATLGVLLDRFVRVPLILSFGATAVGLALWLASKREAPHFLLVAVLAIGAARHHLGTKTGDDSIARFATEDGVPAGVLGRLATLPTLVPGNDDPLLSMPRQEATLLVVDATEIRRGGLSEPTGGRVIAFVPGRVEPLYPGDVVEVFGRLALPRGPGNPGEVDSVQRSSDRGIDAILSASSVADGVRVVAHTWRYSLFGWLGRLHAECKKILYERLPTQPALATALLLGDGSGIDRAEWDKFLRSGVVHALAISGQHLVVLAMFLVFVRRLFFVRQRPAIVAIAVILFGYAILTGGRPPAVRAAWMVAVAGLAVLACRQSTPRNTLAFAWLGVLLVNPADVFDTGCLLSFLAVLVIQEVANPFVRPDREAVIDPMSELADSTAFLPSSFRDKFVWLRDAYLFSAIIWLGITPLVAERYHVVAPVALLIGPPVVVATSVALLSGFVLLLTAPFVGPLATPIALLTDGSLWVCDRIIDLGLRLPGASFSIANVPNWWTIGFYVLFLAPWMIGFGFPRRRLRTASLILAAVWLILGIGLGRGAFRSTEFRVAFLSVGHGGCTVIETEAGKTLVYDAGAITGPELTRRIVLPYLWSRGIVRIDELFLSHGDLDHFSGVPDLASQIAIGRVRLTPSFADRTSPAVQRVQAELSDRGIPTDIVKAGDEERIGELRWGAMHPPEVGPAGNENARSMVLLLRHRAFAVLLTGDLEGTGIDRVLALPSPAPDVFMAPHHGSRLAAPAALAHWAKARLVVSSQGRPRSVGSVAADYESAGATFLTTFHDGAILLSERDGRYEATTFRTKRVIPLGAGRVR